MMISLIVAVANNGVIGHNNDLPWHISADLQNFKRITTGHCMVLGRKNYESIGRALPQRTNIVLTRQKDFIAPGCVVLHDLPQALEYARAQGESEVFIIGGAEIYRQAWPLIHKIYLTWVHRDFTGDVFFPFWDSSATSNTPLGEAWKNTHREEFPAVEDIPAFSFL